MPQTINKNLYRIQEIRNFLIQNKLDGYLQPRADSFLGEYVPKSSARLEWLSGFSGSAGEILILLNKSILFVDSRYIIQAKQETKGTDIEVVLSSEYSFKSWVKRYLNGKNIKIAIDPWLYSYKFLSDIIDHAKGHKLEIVMVKTNPIDSLWKSLRPKAPNSLIQKHAIKYSGISANKKIKSLCEIFSKKNVYSYLISKPESLAWLLNIRGSDLKHTPVILCRAILFKNEKLYLFINKNRIKPNIIKYLKSEIRFLKIFDESKFLEIVTKIANMKKLIWIDPQITPYIIAKMAQINKNKIYLNRCPIEIKKAIKNKTEIKGSIIAHKRDGVALCKFLYWLKNSKYSDISEISAAEKINYLRGQQKNFISTSFDTISGFASNGAIVHYRVSGKSNKNFTNNNIYLCDSGGQYLDGTTDVTRTIIIGKPNPEMKKDFTIVLKGHIALSTAKFPVGTSGSQLDILARNPLWKNNMDYGHGTGHGVGSYLSVHEGPQGISKGSLIPLQEGMILSNEPGFYRTNKYGIRIENLVVVVRDKDYLNNNMLSFKTLTYAPIDIDLIDFNLLHKEEIDWINLYHSEVYKQTAKNLLPKEKKWLKEICKQLN